MDVYNEDDQEIPYKRWEGKTQSNSSAGVRVRVFANNHHIGFSDLQEWLSAVPDSLGFHP